MSNSLQKPVNSIHQVKACFQYSVHINHKINKKNGLDKRKIRVKSIRN